MEGRRYEAHRRRNATSCCLCVRLGAHRLCMGISDCAAKVGIGYYSCITLELTA